MTSTPSLADRDRGGRLEGLVRGGGSPRLPEGIYITRPKCWPSMAARHPIRQKRTSNDFRGTILTQTGLTSWKLQESSRPRYHDFGSEQDEVYIWNLKLKVIRCGGKIQENMDMGLAGDLVCFSSTWSRSPWLRHFIKIRAEARPWRAFVECHETLRLQVRHCTLRRCHSLQQCEEGSP